MSEPGTHAFDDRMSATAATTRRPIDRRTPWYPHDAAGLRAMIERFATAPDRVAGYGLIVPHAGFAYSGECANIAWSSVELPSRVLIIALDHRGGARLDLWPGGPWETPFGDVAGATDLIDALAQVPGVTLAAGHHPQEHSGDNQMPLLAWHRAAAGRDVRVAVLNVGVSARRPGAVDFMDDTAAAIAAMLARDFGNERVLIAASSDMSHEQGHGNLQRVQRQDAAVRDALERYDLPALHAAIEAGATMCGSVPVGLMMRIARQLGATRCEVLDQRTSADATGVVGDYLVGYLSARVV